MKRAIRQQNQSQNSDRETNPLDGLNEVEPGLVMNVKLKQNLQKGNAMLIKEDQRSKNSLNNPSDTYQMGMHLVESSRGMAQINQPPPEIKERQQTTDVIRQTTTLDQSKVQSPISSKASTSLMAEINTDSEATEDMH